MNRNVPKLRFKGFNNEWQEKRLGELLEFKNGVNADKDAYGSGVKFINVLDILNNNYIDYDNIIGYVDINEETLNKYSVNYGDVLFQRSSETREEVGSANVYLGKQTVTFGGFVIRGKKVAEYNPLFINGLLKSSRARKEITSRSGGSTRYNVGQDTLSQVFVKMPDINEQEKIANFLTKVDKIIEKQEEKVKNLENYKKSMMQKIFSQEIRFKDENGEDYPEWEELTFNDILVEDLYPVPKPSEKYEKISVRSHAKGTFSSIVDKPEEVNMDTLYEVKEKQLIVNITFAWEHAIAIVKKEDENKLVSHRFPTYKFKENANYEFYGNYIKLPIVKYKLSLASPGGAGRNRVLNKKEFLKIEVPVPCIDEQMKIAKFLSDIDNIAEKEQKKLEKMRVWKKGLLQQMFV